MFGCYSRTDDCYGGGDEVAVCLIGSRRRGRTGRPVPRVTWYEDGRPVESRVEYLPTRQIRSALTLPALGRGHHGVRYSCAASNSRILTPLVSDVVVRMRRESLSFFFLVFFFPFLCPGLFAPTPNANRGTNDRRQTHYPRMTVDFKSGK